jgi:hypothetical protein
MKIDTPELIQEYYQKVKHLYPDVPYEEFKLACTTPFLFARKEMESGELKTIRLKFFGTFLVYPKRAKSMLEKMKSQFQELKLDAKVFFTKKAMLEKYLEKHESTK